MKDMIDKTVKNWEISVNSFLAVLYFARMLRFYLTDYYVPDFSLYHSFALQHLKAKDGFSSLFILLSALLGSYPKQMTVLCLVLLALSLFNIGFFAVKIMEGDKWKTTLALLLLYSSGIWYYFYGKTFYDFPFSAFTYSLCLLCVVKILDGKCGIKPWYFFSALCGFLMSWKMYNIFCFAGSGLLILCKNEIRESLFSALRNVKRDICLLFCFAIGYICGNFHLIRYPKETVKGIMAYPASCNIGQFFFCKTKVSWDHVCMLPFNLSVMNLFTMCILLVVIPIIYQKFRYLFVSVFMYVCFCIFIRGFSPGYVWHGFTFGLFIITYVFFLLSEIHIDRAKMSFFYVAIGVQLVNCFACYFLTQEEWFDKTEEAEKIVYENADMIYEDIENMVEDIGQNSFRVEVAVKRYHPIATAEAVRDRSLAFVKTGYIFCDPFMMADYNAWNDMTTKDNYSDGDSEYVIWILPNIMMTMGDVVDEHLFDSYEKIRTSRRNGYSVFLLRNPAY